ncbi:MAG: ABC transporter permease [Cyclobacteriaceae bacterium]
MSTQHPPKWAVRFLHWFCDPELIEDLEGDLFEIFDRKCAERGKVAANAAFSWLVLRSFRWSVFKKSRLFKNSTIMATGQNWKVATRVLWRDKFNTGLNTLGLSIGIICFVLLGLYTYQELTFDQFHSKKDRIYRAWLYEDYGNNKVFFNSVTPFRFVPLFKENFPEFEKVVQRDETNLPVSIDDGEVISEQMTIISPDFFEVFDFTFIDGDQNNPFDSRYSIILSRDYAKKYFGETNPMGKTLDIHMDETSKAFTVSAIIDNMPQRSSIRFDMAISSELNRELFGPQALEGWMTVSPETFVLLKENNTIASVNDKSQDVVMSYLSERMERDQYNIGFQPLTDIHLNTEIPLGISPVSNPTYVYVLGIIGLLVLLTACINYTTLAVGQSLKRSKEVGVRKVLGAMKRRLVFQYLTESILVALISTAVGTIVAILLIPTFNSLANVHLVYDFEFWHIGIFLVVALLTGFFAGIYPSLVLTSTRIMSILKPGSSQGGHHWVRKFLITAQFLITVMLISSTLIMKEQVTYLKNQDLGFSYDAVISVPMFGDPQARGLLEDVSSAERNYDLLKPRLEKYPQISDVTMASHSFGRNGWANLAFTDNEGTFRRFRLLGTDDNYLKAFDIKIVDGRDFQPDNGLDERQSILINETAAAYFGFENPIGESLPGKDFGEHKIIGVVEDFHYTSLHYQIEPLVITQNIAPIYKGISDGDLKDSVIPKMFLRYKGSQLTEVEEILSKEWKATFPNQNLDYQFVDEHMARQYENEARLNSLIGMATFIAILIASIGLLGLTLLVVNSREKEIGIRKVIGASVYDIMMMLTKTFSWQLIIGIGLSVPVTIWLMQKWLEDFAYHINIGAGMFVLSAVLSATIALVVIGYHAWRTNKMNPVNSLRSE